MKRGELKRGLLWWLFYCRKTNVHESECELLSKWEFLSLRVPQSVPEQTDLAGSGNKLVPASDLNLPLTDPLWSSTQLAGFPGTK